MKGFASLVALFASAVATACADAANGVCTTEAECKSRLPRDWYRKVIAMNGDETYSDEDKARSKAAIPGMDFDDFGYPTGSTQLAAVTNYPKYKAVPGDVWVCTWPKSGTNWVKQIVNLINLNGDEDAIKKFEDTNVDLSTYMPIPDVMPVDFDTMPRPRTFFTHFRKYAVFPDGIGEDAKILYVFRNPEAATASLLSYLSPLDFGHGLSYVNHTVDDCAELTMDGLQCYGSWEKHVKSFMDGSANTLFLFYENLKENLAHEVARIAKFIGKDLTKAQLEVVREKSTLKYMKTREHLTQGKEWIESVGGQDLTGEYTLVSTGESGRVKYSPEVQKRWAHWWKEKVAPLVGAESYEMLRARYK